MPHSKGGLKRAIGKYFPDFSDWIEVEVEVSSDSEPHPLIVMIAKEWDNIPHDVAMEAAYMLIWNYLYPKNEDGES